MFNKSIETWIEAPNAVSLITVTSFLERLEVLKKEDNFDYETFKKELENTAVFLAVQVRVFELGLFRRWLTMRKISALLQEANVPEAIAKDTVFLLKQGLKQALPSLNELTSGSK